MKKTLTTLSLLLICLTVFGQTRKLTLKDFKTWSIQGNLNSNISNGDIANNTPLYSKTALNFGTGLRVNKFFSNNFGIALDLFNGKLSGEDGNWSYNSNINYQTSILLVAQTGNIRYFDELKRFQLYGYVGYGTLNYSSESKNSVWSNKNASYKGNYQVIPVGFGLKYHLANDLTANVEYSFNNVNGDRLDGFEDYYTNYDRYSRFTVGISYAIGKSFYKELEWHDPRPLPSQIPVRKDTVFIIQQSVKEDNVNTDSILTSLNNKIEKHLNDSSYLDSVYLSKTKLTIFYEFNEYKLPILYHYKLQNIGLEALNRNNSRIIIESFTDTIGSPENNQIIVKRRSKEIYDYFIKIGIPKNIIDIKLHDEKDALLPTDQENRKSIVYILK
jgi:outer membrane protein OmpA-like peptidoglycan-associated protein